MENSCNAEPVGPRTPRGKDPLGDRTEAEGMTLQGAATFVPEESDGLNGDWVEVELSWCCWYRRCCFNCSSQIAKFSMLLTCYLLVNSDYDCKNLNKPAYFKVMNAFFFINVNPEHFGFSRNDSQSDIDPTMSSASGHFGGIFAISQDSVFQYEISGIKLVLLNL